MLTLIPRDDFRAAFFPQPLCLDCRSRAICESLFELTPDVAVQDFWLVRSGTEDWFGGAMGQCARNYRTAYMPHDVKAVFLRERLILWAYMEETNGLTRVEWTRDFHGRRPDRRRPDRDRANGRRLDADDESPRPASDDLFAHPRAVRKVGRIDHTPKGRPARQPAPAGV